MTMHATSMEATLYWHLHIKKHTTLPGIQPWTMTMTSNHRLSLFITKNTAG